MFYIATEYFSTASSLHAMPAPGVTFSPFMASESQRKGGKKQSLPALE